MRIRKNTKLSSMLFATSGYGGERPATYVCHLNQSPWDVIPVSSAGDCDDAADLTNLLDSSWFLPSSSSSSPPLISQFDGEDSFNGNVSLGDSNGAGESLERLNLISAMDNYERSPDLEESIDRSDNSDKKSKAVEPNSPVKPSADDEQVAFTMPAPPKRGRPRGTAKKALVSTAASNNLYEFYYYSGFGPWWGRKRGDSGDEKIVIGDEKKSYENNMIKKSCSSDEEDDKTATFEDGSSCFDGFEYVEEDYDDLVDHDKKLKRVRKPVKERSLKSLM